MSDRCYKSGRRIWLSCASHYAYLYVRSVGSLALGPHLFSVVLPIEQNTNWKDGASLLFQPDWTLVIETINYSMTIKTHSLASTQCAAVRTTVGVRRLPPHVCLKISSSGLQRLRDTTQGHLPFSEGLPPTIRGASPFKGEGAANPGIKK